ncbi:MAG TPA: hypothetical protein VFM88_22975 [Vicinamibacteria bacterium]|nr:hypothetical protein [Vicinamibacteria bacterium]
MARGDEQQRARVEAFARQNWTALAAFAWRAYKEQGRGGLLIGWGAVEAWEAGQEVTVAPDYVTYTEVARFSRLIASYDPEKAIVIALTRGGDGGGTIEVQPMAEFRPTKAKVIRPGASFGAWTFAFEPPPPEALASTAH